MGTINNGTHSIEYILQIILVCRYLKLLSVIFDRDSRFSGNPGNFPISGNIGNFPDFRESRDFFGSGFPNPGICEFDRE